MVEKHFLLEFSSAVGPAETTRGNCNSIGKSVVITCLVCLGAANYPCTVTAVY
jgi:hypothetical protein